MSTIRTNRRIRTSLEIEQLLEGRIRQGAYGESAQLPTVRDMAGVQITSFQI
jgi:DNA-binding transcriptional regulator YhcF (GntR family)